MWKKPLGSYQTQNVKGKDVKSLKRLAGDGSALPDKCEVTLWKVEPRLHVYAVAGVPLYVDTTGRLTSAPIPTIYALWDAPDLLPCVSVVPEVSRFILNGADLMWPGVCSLHLPMKKGQLVQVRVRGNPKAIAVGETCTDTALALAKGKCVKILHHFGDNLCSQAPRSTAAPEGFGKESVKAIASPTPTPNPAAHVDPASPSDGAGPTPSASPAEEAEADAEECEEGEELEEWEEYEEAEEECEEGSADQPPPDAYAVEGVTLEDLMEGGDGLDEDDEVPAVEGRPADRGDGGEEGGDDSEESSSEKKSNRQARMEALKAKKEQKAGKKGKGSKQQQQQQQQQGAQDGGEAAPQLSTEEMDDLVLHCFVAGLSGLTKSDLPILVSGFYSQNMLPSRPAGSEVVLKSSSFKKIGNFMKLMEKEGAIKLKQKSAGVDQIVDMDKRCKFIHEVTKRIGKPDAAAAAGKEASGPSSSNASLDVLPKGVISQVTVRYRPKGDSAVFKPVFKGGKEALTVKEVRSMMDAYIAAEGLPVRGGEKGGKGSRPDPLVTTNDTLAYLWPKKAIVQRSVLLKRLSEKASLGFKTDPTLKVTVIEPDSCASGSELRSGDVVVAVGGVVVKSIPEMGAQMKLQPRNVELTIKTPDTCPKEAKLSDLHQRALKHTLPAYSITYAKDGVKDVVVGKGDPPHIGLDVRNRASKKVTYVNNLDRFGFDVQATAKDLQLSLAGSVTVLPPMAPASSTILLQGRQLKQLVKFFEVYNIPKDCIMVSDKTVKK